MTKILIAIVIAVSLQGCATTAETFAAGAGVGTLAFLGAESLWHK
jgi:uncharacterized protein YceK